MRKDEIEIEIDKTGHVQVRALDVEGGDCVERIKMIARMVGRITDFHHEPDIPVEIKDSEIIKTYQKY